MKSVEEVILENEKLVYKLASKYKSLCSLEDLYQVGNIGIIKAYSKYNGEYNSKFSTYAYKYILGEMIDFIRKDRNIIVSEDYYKIYKKYTEIKELLFTKFEREPSIKEICTIMEIDEHALVEILEHIAYTKSIDENIIYNLSNDERDEIDTKIYLQSGLEELNSFDRNIINYRYYQGYTQSQTANLMGVSQVKISRQEKLILQKLKTSMS